MRQSRHRPGDPPEPARDPLLLNWYWRIGMVYLLLSRIDEALIWLEEAGFRPISRKASRSALWAAPKQHGSRSVKLPSSPEPLVAYSPRRMVCLASDVPYSRQHLSTKQFQHAHQVACIA